MSGLGLFDYAFVALLGVRRLGFRRSLYAALALGAVAWLATPRHCGCIRLPLQRCIYTPRYRASVRSDARQLVSMQEIYFADSRAYADDPAAVGFVASDGVEVQVTGSGDRWRAWVTHRDAGTWEGCMIDVRRPDGTDPGADVLDCRFD